MDHWRPLRSLSPVSMVASPDDRRYLHRGNDRDVLKPTHEPEHEWLRIERRVRIERWRWRQYVVHPALDRIPAGQRTVQLINKTRLSLVAFRRGRLLIFAGLLQIGAIANQSQQHEYSGRAEAIHIR